MVQFQVFIHWYLQEQHQKQIENEKNMLPVSFGAMLMESMLAIIALIAVASFADGEAAAQGLTTQPQIFAGAIANFLSVVGSAAFACIYI